MPKILEKFNFKECNVHADDKVHLKQVSHKDMRRFRAIEMSEYKLCYSEITGS